VLAERPRLPAGRVSDKGELDVTEFDEANERGYFGTSPDDSLPGSYGLQGGAGLTYSPTGSEPSLWVGQWGDSDPDMTDHGGTRSIAITEDNIDASAVPTIAHTLVAERLQIDEPGFYVLRLEAHWSYNEFGTNTLVERPVTGANWCDIVGLVPVGGDPDNMGQLFDCRLTLTPGEVGTTDHLAVVQQSFIVPMNAGMQLGIAHVLGMRLADNNPCHDWLETTNLNIFKLAG
jgi:hypothetical protein